MLKLIIGVKGTGKTKQLIEMVNASLLTSKGDVVCVEKGDKLRFDVKYQCRLIDSENYGITGAPALYGFVAGILASNHDVTDLYVDSALKICEDNMDLFDEFVDKIGAYAEHSDVNFVMTASLDESEASETVKKYI
ncbi:MAG: hypothetical protein PUC29_01770 [Clostridia bacterium]|nr:hypothetical protein [Clostridia bacterium]